MGRAYNEACWTWVQEGLLSLDLFLDVCRFDKRKAFRTIIIQENAFISNPIRMRSGDVENERNKMSSRYYLPGSDSERG